MKYNDNEHEFDDLSAEHNQTEPEGQDAIRLALLVLFWHRGHAVETKAPLKTGGRAWPDWWRWGESNPRPE